MKISARRTMTAQDEYNDVLTVQDLTGSRHFSIAVQLRDSSIAATELDDGGIWSTFSIGLTAVACSHLVGVRKCLVCSRVACPLLAIEERFAETPSVLRMTASNAVARLEA
jgi:hypothetical protein